MIDSGTSTRRIRRYLHDWLRWWANSSNTWKYHELLAWFLETCWSISPVGFAIELMQRHFSRLHAEMPAASRA